MKLFFFTLLFIGVTAAGAQTVKDNRIILGNTDSVKSQILNETRKVWVYVPASYNPKAAHKQLYPVVYLLDGDDHFPSVVGMIQQLSEVNGNSICPDMIVVGITNTDRTRDLTPTNSLFSPDRKKTDGLKTSGGGEKFTAFIEKELIPHIDSLYPVAPYKILIGHSLGGLTAMNIIINHTNMFNAYVAIDPSMWWDGGKLLHETHEALKQKRFDGTALFLGIANTMPAGMDTMRVRKDTSWTTEHIRFILELTHSLKGNSQNGLNWQYKYYNDDNHGSVPLIAEYDALHFLFSYYPWAKDFFSQLNDAKNKIDVEAVISEHYSNISKHLGYKVLPPEDLLNYLGGHFLQNIPDRAYAFFDLAIKNYPDSFSANNSMGDYYSNQKNKEKAGEFYTKALKIKDDPETRKKLDKIQSAK
jgi:predicted alpha/beta superfamily hydrolase